MHGQAYQSDILRIPSLLLADLELELLESVAASKLLELSDLRHHT